MKALSSDTARNVLAGLAAGVLLGGCSVTTNTPEGATTGTGENSSFTEAGIEQIIEDGEATIDLRSPLLASDLGADEQARLRDLDERGEDPIEVTLLGANGELVVPAEVIRILVQPEGAEIQSIAVFEGVEDAADLAERLREVAGTVGFDDSVTEPILDQLTDAPEQEHDRWLNGGTALGPTVGLNAVHHPDGDSLLQYELTPPA
ncbi:hypothetical protein [Ruania zhangjianzhongii]|uniref:hypothetical protein n=1 Tax=Ruania zhangjianzhongii TaxID=2603206 RepID=UPI0011C8D646|nr:hypothetical protein [Ruania zhangjianzhongii]